jgi:dihydroorotase
MKIVIKNGHVIDPSQGIDGVCDIFLEDGKIKEVRSSESEVKNKKKKFPLSPDNPPVPPLEKRGKEGFERRGISHIIDAEGMLVMPGLVDMHVHLREPGFEYKETIKTGTESAARGGFTSICCMPNTYPVNDNSSVTEFIIRKAIQEGSCFVYPVGSVTKGQKGEEIAELTMMHETGCVAFSDDGRPVKDTLLMRRAFEYSRIFNAPIISHCEDLSLSADGVMNEGLLSFKLGLKGIPVQSEEIIVARDIALSELTGGRLHIAHASTKGSVELIRAAKKRGIANLTAETCPHYFSITEEAVCGYNTNAKVNPPLRRKEDVESIKEALADGTIDVIATDHAPHHLDEKIMEFDHAPSGISGLETAVGLSMKLVDEGILTLKQLVEKMAFNPAKIVGINKGTLKQGSDADIVVVDTRKEYRVNVSEFKSKGKNTPFEGWILNAVPILTISNGEIYKWE